MYERGIISGHAAVGGVAIAQSAGMPAGAEMEAPKLELLENALADLCINAQKLKHRIGAKADNILGPRPEPAAPQVQVAGQDQPHGPVLLRIERLLRALRSELEAAHYQQDRIETL